MKPLKSHKVTTLHSTYASKQIHHQQKLRKKKRALYHRLIAMGICALIMSYIMFSILHSQAEAMEQKLSEKKELEEQYQQLLKEEEYHRDEILKLNDEDYVAKLARNEYFLSEEDEIIFKLPSQTP